MLKYIVIFIQWLVNLYNDHKKIFVSYVACLAILTLTGWLAFSSNSFFAGKGPPKMEKISLTEFWKNFKNEKITDLTFFSVNRKIYGTMWQGADKINFSVKIPLDPKVIGDSLQVELVKYSKTNTKTKINFAENALEYDDPRIFLKDLFWMIFAIIFVITLIFFFNQKNFLQAKSFTKENTGKIIEQIQKVKFADVGGIDEAVEEVKIAVEFLKEPEKFTRLGAKMPKGYLLVGPPGTGKTLLAKAVAGESNRPFFSVEGAGLVEIFVGVGPARVKKLFENAAQNKPCIIFIDDIDSVGRARDTSKIGHFSGGSQEYENTLLQLLVCMDGMNTRDGIIIFGATNRPESLDQALVRPGRFDRQIVISRPDFNGRKAILKIHTKDVKLNENFNYEKVAKSIPGFTGADIANLVNSATILATRKNKEQVDAEDFSKSRDDITQGSERKILISEKEKEMIAYHESGHTIAAIFTKNAEPIEKVSVIPRGMSLGATFQTNEDNVLLTKEQIIAKLVVMMSGREGEKIISGTISTGAKDDLEKATNLARKMVCEWGMSEKIGPIIYSDQNSAFLSRDGTGIISSEKTRYEIEQEIKNIIAVAQNSAIDLIHAREKELKTLAKELLEKETLYKEEIDLLLSN